MGLNASLTQDPPPPLVSLTGKVNVIKGDTLPEKREGGLQDSNTGATSGLFGTLWL